MRLYIVFLQKKKSPFQNCKQAYQSGSIQFSPVSLEGFHRSFISCNGVLCTAGFETPAEAIFMGKKLCVVPMKNQYEQACNAAFLVEMGIPAITNQHEIVEGVKKWLKDDFLIQIAYPDQTRDIVFSLTNIHTPTGNKIKGGFKMPSKKSTQKQVKSSPVSSRLRQRHL